jgi:hypothetical protein
MPFLPEGDDCFKKKLIHRDRSDNSQSRKSTFVYRCDDTIIIHLIKKEKQIYGN